MSERPDTSQVLAGLKDFQRNTVDYVFERLYVDEGTRKFLVADEVGLGKTLVARGMIARTIDHLWEEVDRIDIIYICSNADIARQNMCRLSIPGCEITAQSTRLTLLPVHLHALREKGVNLIALTPSTSFEQSGGGGRFEERVLLYWLLHRAWGIRGLRSSIHVLRDYMGDDRFEDALGRFEDASVNEELATAFVEKLAAVCEEQRAQGGPCLRARFEDLRGIFHRSDAKVFPSGYRLRSQWLGEMRRLLALVCLGALEPDLIILDEFQRFKPLLEDESEAGELARHLFDSEAGMGARVLLLSATPYRGLSLHHEDGGDHYGDFLALVEFLEDGDPSGLKEIVAEYREAIPAVRSPEGLERLRRAKNALQDRLRRVMARTERIAANGGEGMLEEIPAHHATLRATDVQAYLGAQEIANMMGEGDVVEYWKSAPYLFNFMDSYALKRAFKEAARDREMVLAVRRHPEVFLDLDRVRHYREIDPANSRLRALVRETVGRGMWRLLWIPPSMPYYRLSGAFGEPELRKVTKRLVFSAWHMVPKAIASFVSYEAERRMMRSPGQLEEVSQEDWKKQTGLLRFGVAPDRLTGMPLLLLVYPAMVFARDYDPRDFARESLLSSAELLGIFSTRLREAVRHLPVSGESGGNVDERWYWLAPMLLDRSEFPDASMEWWQRDGLAERLAGIKARHDEIGWPRHLDLALQTLSDVWEGRTRLGPQPDDLFEVLALAASAAPATAALRTYARTSREGVSSIPLRDAAAQTGRAFLTLFNHAEVIEMIRAEYVGEPYWLRVLEYGHGGGLQSTLDEYTHLLRESLGAANESAEEMAGKIRAEVVDAVTLRAASLRVDAITAPPHTRHVEPESSPLRIRFAMRFGDERNDEGPDHGSEETTRGTRKERVRAAFNSPFWPFVMATTSVGQEGLDFHRYCHAVTHWNLPANPVDLEQREGRIHRYKGHAVRKNVAASVAPQARLNPGSDVWLNAFEAARAGCSPGQNELTPYWLFPGEAKIERHVPMLPYSREVDRLEKLRHALAIYRMVFGQSRQEDLIAYLLAEVPEVERDALVGELQIDLCPPGRL